MGVYKSAIITDAGQALIANAIVAGETVAFTEIKTSSYSYPSGTNIAGLTDIQDIVQTVMPFSAQVFNDTLVQVSARFDNKDVEAAYLIETLGLYAQAGTEEPILFAVVQATSPDQMPASSTVSPSAFIYNIQITVQQASQISVTVNPAGTATVQDILDLQAELEQHADSHNLKTYTSLEQIGITVGEETILGIAKAMPAESELLIAVSATSGYNSSEYPSSYGTLYARKHADTRIYFEFSKVVNNVSEDSKVTKVWRGECNADTETWKGWVKCFDEANPPTPAQVGAVDLGNSRTAIPKGADLNNYINPGCFSCQSNATAGTLSNCPVKYGFSLDVYNILGTTTEMVYQYRMQVLTVYQTGSTNKRGAIHIRFYHNENGTISFSEWYDLAFAGDFLPLTGGALSDNLSVKRKSYPSVFAYDESTDISSLMQQSARTAIFGSSDGKNYRAMGVIHQTNGTLLRDAFYVCEYTDGVYVSRALLGKHNKPSGQYSATNSTERRTIETGGIESNIIIGNTNGFALVNSQGAICKLASGTSVYGLPASQVSYSNGVLILATTDKCLNYQGNYYYQCL